MEPPSMQRLRLGLAMTLAGIVVAPAPATRAQGVPGPERTIAIRFIQGLRERGYHDLALDYLDGLRRAPDTPPDLREILDFEQGRGLLEEANVVPDLDRRRELLEQA